MCERVCVCLSVCLSVTFIIVHKITIGAWNFGSSYSTTLSYAVPNTKYRHLCFDRHYGVILCNITLCLKNLSNMWRECLVEMLCSSSRWRLWYMPLVQFSLNRAHPAMFRKLSTAGETVRATNIKTFCSSGATACSGPGPSQYWGFTITLRHTSHSVGLLWAGDQPDAETSARQHITLRTDRHPCFRGNSNP
jgi:hypothetical protein